MFWLPTRENVISLAKRVAEDEAFAQMKMHIETRHGTTEEIIREVIREEIKEYMSTNDNFLKEVDTIFGHLWTNEVQAGIRSVINSSLKDAVDVSIKALKPELIGYVCDAVTARLKQGIETGEIVIPPRKRTRSKKAGEVERS